MQIAVGHTVNDRILDKAFLSWEDVTGRIQQLLAQGEYAPQVVLDAARQNAVTEHAQALAYMERDLAEGVSELVFEDTSVFRGGFPDVLERLSGLLEQPEFLSDLNERLEGLAIAYEEEPELMRFKTYRPDKMAAQFQQFAKEVIPYQARDGFAWQEHGYFITQDEIDAFLSRGGSFENGRLSTYAYFIADHTDAEKTDFIKERYGTGGSSHVLSGADDSHADYSAKGLTLARGSYGEPYASTFLTWTKVAQRVNHLIRMEQFLKPEDYSRMPEYERAQMARSVIAFYGRLPEDIKRPFNEDFFGEDARKELSAILEDPERAEGLLAEMDSVLAALPLDFDRYEERAQILSDLHQYVDGTYTIFPEKKQEVEHTPVSGRQMSLFDYLGMGDLQSETDKEPEKQETEKVQEEPKAGNDEIKADESAEQVSYSREQGTFLYLDSDHLYQVERVSDSDVILKDMENPSSAPLTIPMEDYDGRLDENPLNQHLKNGENPNLKDSRCVYKECLYTMLEAVRQSEIYPTLRDRDTDEDMAVSIIWEKVSELMAANSGSAPVFYEAGEHWEHFTDWMVEDIFQRTYQDYMTDSRDAVALYQNNPESPEWVRGMMVEASRQEIALPADFVVQDVAENPEVVARFQSTVAMQDGYVEDIAILQYPSGNFFNHYGYDEERGIGAAIAGPFDTLEDARQTVLAHRPDAQEIEVQQMESPSVEIPEKERPVRTNEPQSMFQKAYEEYLSIKERYPDTLVGFETEGHYEFFGDDARMVSEILGSK
ncbi:MAG: hypothetical protein LUI87_02435, partial [Lachnospiraceae bacterium]|nr:hypothetical protein [Lachnospiraceae bacterium]